ncbi:TonB-dependent receptor family protein [Pseudomarimonas salicorniae]|uniref:TonB-dependent receptor n=1 Tax=Pseudomarimonas salicorniae TaxID=2933270 RepID=A0ABT0GEY2_9GAMM|nr:TonB-dependent receptor [Lysobacter sp. CAU 1642]MCK7593105.1 TonB-dependent receptor [Lysobacter sp. CAU 1642]
MKGSRRTALIGLALAPVVQAQDATLETIEVVGAPLENASPALLPATLDRLYVDDTDSLQVGLGEALARLPGVLVRERQNFAQDTQLSIRGVGARATFGIRGIRLYLDGIPATLPDGQGQLSHFLLASAGRVDVLRGPFSALYGNAAGGVIQVHSARIDTGDAWRLRAATGSHGAYDTSARWLHAGSGYDASLTAARFASDGFREHSEVERNGLNGLFGFDAGSASRLQIAFNLFDSPQTLDPLGLTREQWREDPSQATSAALLFNTRKSVSQAQLGASWQLDLDDGSEWRLAAYRGERDIEQFLSVPVFAQRNPLSSGGVIDLDNVYDGADLRHARIWSAGAGELSLTLGIALERLDQRRRGFENFIDERLGVRGRLRRDERNSVESRDHYAQLQWAPCASSSLLLGLRRAEVRFASRDGFIAAGNPDDSGSVRYAETTPVAGLVHRWSPGLRGWMAYGRGFETPTFNELSYRADGGAGLAFGLRPAISRSFEAGLEGAAGDRHAWRLVAFRGDTRNELAVVRNVGGRSSFRNVGSSRRQGIEAQFDLRLSEVWAVQATATWLDARFRSPFVQCSGPGCTDPATPVPAGSRIPGLAARQAHLRLDWTPWQAWRFALEAEALSSVRVADAAGERAPGYGLTHLLAERRWHSAGAAWRAFLRLDNLFDRDHVGSVIVNEGNGRYYEPGPGRTVSVGLQWDFSAQ